MGKKKSKVDVKKSVRAPKVEQQVKSGKKVIEVDLTPDDVLREEVLGLTLSGGSYFAQIPQKDIEPLRKKLEKLRDDRKPWIGTLFLAIKKKMKLRKFEKGSLDVEELRTDETLIAFGDKMILHMKFDREPKQKTIKESLKHKGDDDGSEMDED